MTGLCCILTLPSAPIPNLPHLNLLSYTLVLLGFPVANMVKNLPAMQEIQVRSLGREKEMATCSSILAWRIP